MQIVSSFFKQFNLVGIHSLIVKNISISSYYGVTGQAVLPFAIWLHSKVILILPHVVLLV